MNAVKTMTSFLAPVELVDQVRRLAAEHDRSMSSVIRRAIQEHVQREEQEANHQ